MICGKSCLIFAVFQQIERLFYKSSQIFLKFRHDKKWGKNHGFFPTPDSLKMPYLRDSFMIIICRNPAGGIGFVWNPCDWKADRYILRKPARHHCKIEELVEMWYVIQTKIGQEEPIRERVEKMLPVHFYEDCKILYYVKKKKYLGEWHEERERLLPGYMFLVTDDPEPVSEVLNRMTEFTRLLGSGNTFCPICPEEEELLIKLTRGKDEIGMSYGVIEKGILKVSSGVLTGMESRIKKIDRHKRKGFISMRIDDKEKLVGVGLEITEKS